MSEQKTENKTEVKSEDKKPKFGARIARASFAGMPLSFMFFVVNYFFSSAINMLANKVVFDPIAFGLLGFAVGVTSSIATELSKELES